ncbi:MAG: hypothetical protein HYV09_40920 [Deltaproteobacteria bacterium]|nr:hypothetical protein [Deltaproteobacteria bacterium]
MSSLSPELSDRTASACLFELAADISWKQPDVFVRAGLFGVGAKGVEGAGIGGVVLTAGGWLRL